MADYTVAQLKAALENAGASGQALDVATAIALAENSGRSLTAVNTAGNYPAGSRDRGPIQINDYWHSDVPDSCAFDLACSAQQMAKISNGFTNFSAWTTFRTGAYMQHLAEATGAVASTAGGILAGWGLPGVTTGPATGPGSILGGTLDSAKKAALAAVFVAGGVGLVVAGLWRAVAPVRAKVNDATEKAGPAVAMAAMA